MEIGGCNKCERCNAGGLGAHCFELRFFFQIIYQRAANKRHLQEQMTSDKVKLHFEHLRFKQKKLLYEHKMNTLRKEKGYKGKKYNLYNRLVPPDQCLCALLQSWECANIQYNGTRVSFYPDYSSEVQRSRVRFNNVKYRLQFLELPYAMLYPEKLWITARGQTHFF